MSECSSSGGTEHAATCFAWYTYAPKVLKGSGGYECVEGLVDTENLEGGSGGISKEVDPSKA